MPMDDFDKLKKSFPAKGFSNTKNIAEDCDRPACEDTMSALSAALKHAKAASPSSSSSSSNSTKECPLSSPALGKSSWDLLHSMAAWYPDTPTPTDETMIRQFYASFSRFYPCTWCAEDFQKNLEKQPAQSDSRESLCLWLCAQHNLVNEKLGKPLFQCNMKNLDERWRKSKDPKCQPR